MIPPPARGSSALRRLLSERLFDLRDLDVDRFRDWLEQHLTHWRGDPVFRQRSRIRDLRLAHPELGELEEERRRARLRYQTSSVYASLEGVSRELSGVSNAVAGLTRALRSAEEFAERQRLGQKLDDFRARLQELQREVTELTTSSDERRALDRVEVELERVRERVGFGAEVAQLEKLQREHGRSSGRSGAAFEVAASEASRSHLLPELGGGSSAPLVVLHGVKLGAARTEIDQLVIRRARVADEPVEVVALIEAKRNPNDLAHGLRRRLENLAWLAGQHEGYDPEVYRTATSPSGHFDGDAVHPERGVGYRFTRDSFARFLPDLGTRAVPRHLYLITRPATLWGVGSAALGRIAHRVASDVAWNPDDPAYLADLLRWCQELAGEIETPDLIRRYAADAEAARRVLLLEV